jgi:hypothetical protein
VKFSKGEFTVRYQLRHDRSELLEKLKDSPLTLERKMEKAVTLNIFADPNTAVTDGAKYGNKKISLGKRSVLFVKRPEDDTLKVIVKICK